MQHQVLYRPSYSLLVVDLAAGEELKAEPGALVSMSGGIQMETGMQGGVLAGLRRAFLGGESFFVNTFRAQQPGEVTFAPALSGDISHLALAGETMYAQSGSFLASGPGVAFDTQWGGARSFFAGEGLVANFTGPGRSLLQTRSPGAFLDWLLPRLPKGGRGGSDSD
jgi:uncharacterized protein (TIGR00266 family)